MAGQNGLADSDDEYHSLSGHESEDEEDEESEEILEPPTHPVPSMQSAFEESIFESTAEENRPSSPLGKSAEERRQKLLESKQYDDAWTTRWKQGPAAKHHPLQKLMAQIVFGLHLLHQQQAKSDHEVVKILQTHVNEVDCFLERTAEDFNLAIRDVEERIRYLTLPMTHLDVFNVMLDEKKFRTQLLEGNDKIEKIIERTSRAMNAALLDVQKGLEANKELGTYLDSVQDAWPKESRGITDVFGAMRGNEQGWERYLHDLQGKGKTLAAALSQLAAVIADIARLAALASRRNKPQSRAMSKSAPVSPGLHSKFSSASKSVPAMPALTRPFNLNKPLPGEPGRKSGAATPKPHPIPFEQRYESPRESPQSPPVKMPRSATVANGDRMRPKTAVSTPNGARTDSRSNAVELAAFSQSTSPSRNNSRDRQTDGLGQKLRSERTSRSSSLGAATLLDGTSNSVINLGISRANSHKAKDVLGISQKPAKENGLQRSNSRVGHDNVLELENGQGRVDSGTASGTTSEVSTQQDALPSAYNSLRKTGFARRLSARVKHLPPPEQTPLESEEKANQNDSAYSSGTDGRKTDSPEKRTLEQSRPASRLGLFPRGNQSSTPSRNNTTATKNNVLGTPYSSVSTPSAKSVASKPEHRGNRSLRNFFHRRDKSRMVTL